MPQGTNSETIAIVAVSSASLSFSIQVRPAGDIEGSSEAAQAQAQVELDKTLVRAGVAGSVQQFTLQPGGIVKSMVRPAGILVPTGGRSRGPHRGFRADRGTSDETGNDRRGDLRRQALHHHSDRWSSPSFRMSSPPGNCGRRISLSMSSKWAGNADRLSGAALCWRARRRPTGASCIANAYTNNHDALADPDIGTTRWLYLHMVDAVAIVHAGIIRMQALLLPVQTLVFSGH